MDQSQTWAQALNINPDQLSEWSADAPSGQPLLVHCLIRGHVDVERYLAWASETFGLPRLNSTFFANACDPELVRGAHELESYSAWFYPVGRWDDVIYIACVEAPPVDDAPPGYCFVLADPRVMNETWNALARDPEATNLTNISIGRDGETVVADVPAGFQSGNTKLFTLNLDGVSLNLDGHLAPPAPEPLNLESAHESTSLMDHADIGEATRVSFTPPALELADDSRVDLPPPTISPTAYTAPAPIQPSVPAPVTPTAPSAPREAPARPQMAIVPEFNPPATHPTPPPRAPRVSAPIAPVSTLTLPTTEAGALTRVFEHLNEFFLNSCVLRRTDAMIRIYKWGLDLTPAGQGVALDLNYPSFLRIVSRTNMPYHGYLIDSPIHREFFRGLGLNELPQCVTAVPLMVDDVLWGVLLTTGTPDRQDLASLAMVESAGQQLTQALSPAWRKVS